MESDELIMVSEALRATFGPANEALLRKLGVDTRGFAPAPPLGVDVDAHFRFAAHPQLLEPVLIERLAERGLDIFEYLVHAYSRLAAERSRAWVAADARAAALIDELRETVRNYLALALGSPELFEGAVFAPATRLFAQAPAAPLPGGERVRRLLQLCAVLPDGEVLHAAVEALQADGTQVHFLLCYFLSQELRLHIISSPELDDVLAVARLLLEHDGFRRYAAQRCDTGALRRGVEVETHTFLGALLSQSLLPLPRDPRLPDFEKRVHDRIVACKTQAAYNKTVESVGEVCARYRRGVHALARQLMREEGAELVMRFLRDAADLNAGRAQLGFLYSAGATAECASHSFGLTALDVLLEFAAPVVTRDALFDKVDFGYMGDAGREMPRTQPAFFGGPPPPVSERSYGSATRFFFYVPEYVGKFLAPAMKYAEQLSSSAQRLGARLAAARSDFERRALEAHVHALRVEFMLYRVALEADERIGALNRFYGRLFAGLLARRPLCVPEHYLNDYVEVQSFLAHVKRGYYGAHFAPAALRTYVQLLEALLGEEHAGANPHVKARFMELLFTLNAVEDGRLVGELRALLQTQARVDAFMRSLLGFYAAVEFMSDGQAGGGKYRYRFLISKFLERALEQREYADALRAALHSKQMSDFVAHMLTDLNYFLEEAFEKMATLRAREAQPPEQQQPPPADGADDAEPDNTAQLREQVKNYLKFGRSYLRLFDKLSQICPAVFEDEEWAFKVARVLNFYAAKMCARSYRAVRLENVRALGLRPLEFIGQLVGIYARLAFSERLKAELIADERSYDKDVLLDIGSTAFRRRLVPEDAIARFEELVLELEARKAERDNLADITRDAPDEFMCGLTFELMSQPVRLPSSDIVVELSAIRQHITLNGEYDPFNRQKLALADLVEQPQLRARIDAWLAERKAQYRAQLRAQQPLKEARAEEYSDTEQERDDESVAGGFLDTLK